MVVPACSTNLLINKKNFEKNNKFLLIIGLITIYKGKILCYSTIVSWKFLHGFNGFGRILMQSRNSAQRNLVLNIMEGNKSHPTADHIYKEARKADPHISRGTVYRNLNLLVENGNVLRIEVPDGAYHFDSNLLVHYHFYCRKCNRLFDVPDFSPLQVIETQKELEKLGYKAVNHKIIFDGICPDCCKEEQ